MQPSLDTTTDPAWIEEQVDRLSGFELLTKFLSGNPTPMPPATLADKLGVNKGFSYGILAKLKENG